MPVEAQSKRSFSRHRMSTAAAASTRVRLRTSTTNNATAPEVPAADVKVLDEDTSMKTASVMVRSQTDIDMISSGRKRQRLNNSSTADAADVRGDTILRVVTNTNTQLEFLASRVSVLEAMRNHHQPTSTQPGHNSLPCPIYPPLANDSGSSTLERRFPWLTDRLFLDLARSGSLRPIDLIRLVNPAHKVEDDMDGAVSTRGSETVRFIHFFSEPSIFAAAWWAWGECLTDACTDSGATSAILSAMSWHLRWLVNQSTTHEWSACMTYHNSVHIKRLCQGQFNTRVWSEGIGSGNLAEFFNSETSLSATSSPAIVVVNNTAKQLQHALKTRRRLAMNVGICCPWNEGLCKSTAVCPHQHKCWVCGDGHPGRRCSEADG